MKKKALIVATVPSFIDQFLMPSIELLQDMEYEVSVACNFNLYGTITAEKTLQLKQMLTNRKVKVYVIAFPRSPFSKKIINAYQQLEQLLTYQKYAIVHCHTPVAGILTRLAARKLRRHGGKVIYTAHGFHFYKDAPLKNWLLYYPAEKMCSYFTDALLTINTEDFNLAQRKMRTKHIYYIPGIGIDTYKTSKLTVDKCAKRKELGFTDENIILLSVGELSIRKNHQVVIRALSDLKSNCHLQYCVAGVGDEKNALMSLAKECHEDDRVHFLGYRTDISELLCICDIFIFPSLQEGLPVALMEAMGAGKPCVVSNIRGNTDLIVASQGGCLVDPLDVNEFSESIQTLANDRSLRAQLGANNRIMVDQFDIKHVNQIMKVIYKEVCDG